VNRFQNWKIAVVLLLVFGAGATVGSVATLLHFKHGFAQALRYETWIEGSLKSLERKLELTPEQLPKVRSLVDQTGQEIRFGLRTTATNTVVSLLRFGDRLDAELSPNQRAVHQGMRIEFREKVRSTLGMDPDQL
jgi:hypothetical protein